MNKQERNLEDKKIARRAGALGIAGALAGGLGAVLLASWMRDHSRDDYIPYEDIIRIDIIDKVQSTIYEPVGNGGALHETYGAPNDKRRAMYDTIAEIRKELAWSADSMNGYFEISREEREHKRYPGYSFRHR
ncbi:hypothetical protein J4447_00595 [Candidatus Pacearchaeota archaeon]|nr:hypothetical protein [Candidatus Pacearchaeota archaeon]